MNKPVILTAPRLSKELHLGNYLGALLPMVQLAQKYSKEYQFNLFIADLHGITTPIDYEKVQPLIHQYLRMFVAAGFQLDQPDIHIYRQSYISAHSELTWILDCFTYMGEMRRMTQFKEKSDGQDNVSVGLFHYPVLMAADILLYGARYIPVGEDQQQHVEIARDISLRMNETFKDKFPDGLFSPPLDRKAQLAFLDEKEALRIRDLLKPDKKMSKSDATGKGVIFLGDDPQIAVKKIMSATTDSESCVRFDFVKQPGISNLLQILAHLTHRPVPDVVRQYEGQSQYGPLKEDAAEAVQNFLIDFQEKLSRVNDDEILSKLESSEAAMNIMANATLLRAQRAVGLRPKQNRSIKQTRLGSKPDLVPFEAFERLDIRFVTVLSAEFPEGSDKLIKLKVTDGQMERQIITATREFFPDLNSLIGKQLPIIANLMPQNFKGHTSEGMFLCADVNGQPILVTPIQPVPDGSPLM